MPDHPANFRLTTKLRWRPMLGTYYSLIEHTTSAFPSHLQWILSYSTSRLSTLLVLVPLPAVSQPVTRRRFLPTAFHGPSLRWAAKNAALQLLRTSRGQIVPSTHLCRAYTKSKFTSIRFGLMVGIRGGVSS